MKILGMDYSFCIIEYNRVSDFKNSSVFFSNVVVVVVVMVVLVVAVIDILV